MFHNTTFLPYKRAKPFSIWKAFHSHHVVVRFNRHRNFQCCDLRCWNNLEACFQYLEVCASYSILITVRNKVVKVMFLHVSVCPQGGVPGQVPPWDQVHPLGPGTPCRYQVHPPLGPGTPPGTRYIPPGPGTPPRRRLLLRTVRILLECIIVVKLSQGLLSFCLIHRQKISF